MNIEICIYTSEPCTINLKGRFEQSLTIKQNLTLLSRIKLSKKKKKETRIPQKGVMGKLVDLSII